METENENLAMPAKKSDPKKSIIIILLIVVIFLFAALMGVLQRKPAVEKQEGVISEAMKVDDATTQSEADTEVSTSQNSTEVASSTSPAQNSALGTAPIVMAHPDLYIVKYDFNKEPATGEEFTVNIKLGNKGNAVAKDFHWEWWPTSNTKACGDSVESLAAGETQIVGCKYSYGGWASYSTKAVVDSKGEVSETNENNNIITKKVIPIHEEAKADLYISEYKYNHPPKMGEAFVVSISIYNKGDAKADSFWWEWWPTSHGKACREKIDSLVAHGGKVVTCPYTYAGWSTYATKAIVDVDDNISESDEDNNSHAENLVPIH